MKKQRMSQKKQDDILLLGDRLGTDLRERLREKQAEMKKEETRLKQEAETKRIAEIRLREKNKSFEELLDESSLKWDDFKN